jgi:PAS domain S-box-containing protein
MLRKFTESISVRLIGMYSIVAVLVAGIGITSYAQISRINEILALDTTKRAEARYLSTKIHISTLQIADQVDFYLESGTETERTQRVTQLNDQMVILGELLNQLEERVSVTTEEQDRLGNVKTLIGGYLEHTRAVIAAAKTQDEGGRQSSYKQFADTRSQLVETLIAFEDLETNLSLRSQQEAKDTVNRALVITIVLVITTLIGGLVLGVQLSLTVIRPINRLAEVAQRIAAGDLAQTVDVRGQTEIGALAKAFNKMTAQLRDLVGALEQRVADRTKALSSVAEISATASTILDPNKFLQQIVDLSKERFNFYHSHIYLLNEAGDTLALASGAGEPGRKMVAEEHSIPLDSERSLVARAARERKGVIVNDVTREPDFLPNPLLPNTRSELAAPMMVGDQVIGVFDVQSDVVGRFTDADIAVQTTLASQVASAVQNARLFAQAELARQEAQLLVKYAPEAVVIVDLLTGAFADPNENAEKLYGLPRDELVKVGPAQMSPPIQPDGRDSTEKAMEKIGEAMQGKTPIFEWMHRNAQGEDFMCEVRLTRLPGEHPRVRASVTDISERKRLLELTAQRARQQEALNLITQQIQSADTVEAALQVAARELGRAIGKPTSVQLRPANDRQA